MKGFKIVSKSKIEKLPKTTGVYIFLQKNQIIYIGKALNIKSRVKNHFFQPSYRDNLFMDKVDKIGFFEINSEIETLILEASLIKKYQPKFNVMWRDDKNYFYMAIAKNDRGIPYVLITHQTTALEARSYKLKANFIGPFVEGTALKKTLRYLRKVFPYYTVKKHVKTKCTYCHLELCPGPEPDLTDYKKNIKKLVLVLKGKSSVVLRLLKKEMNEFSKKSQFEEAGKTRDRFFALQQIIAHTHVINNNSFGGLPMSAGTSEILQRILGLKNPVKKIEAYDVSNIQGKQATGSMIVFVDGKPDKNQYRMFRIRMENEPNDIAMLAEVLQRRFNHPEWPFPDAVLIDGGIAQSNIAIKSKLQNPNYKSNPKIQNIKIISIAKRNKELFIEGRDKPVLLKSLPQEVYNLIIHLDDEAHRFAIKYHKNLRKKAILDI